MKLVIKKEGGGGGKIKAGGWDTDSYTTILCIKLSSSFIFLTFVWCAKIYLLPIKLANEAFLSGTYLCSRRGTDLTAQTTVSSTTSFQYYPALIKVIK